MKDPTSDTHPETEAILIEGYRAMTEAQRVRCVRNMGVFSAQLIMADVRARHPEADEEELRLTAASRLAPRRSDAEGVRLGRRREGLLILAH